MIVFRKHVEFSKDWYYSRENRGYWVATSQSHCRLIFKEGEALIKLRKVMKRSTTPITFVTVDRSRNGTGVRIDWNGSLMVNRSCVDSCFMPKLLALAYKRYVKQPIRRYRVELW